MATSVRTAHTLHANPIIRTIDTPATAAPSAKARLWRVVAGVPSTAKAITANTSG